MSAEAIADAMDIEYDVAVKLCKNGCLLAIVCILFSYSGEHEVTILHYSESNSTPEALLNIAQEQLEKANNRAETEMWEIILDALEQSYCVRKTISSN
ncbi:MAG: hypothetical protein QY314_03940 [Candidatus Dojkabacteria bacterium]|nr:MAG: hypothetical protein QY314_03940 [Candidatus Dojkabacteria bacterium]